MTILDELCNDHEIVIIDSSIVLSPFVVAYPDGYTDAGSYADDISSIASGTVSYDRAKLNIWVVSR